MKIINKKDAGFNDEFTYNLAKGGHFFCAHLLLWRVFRRPSF